MPIIRQLTEAEADLQAKEALVLQAGEATHLLAYLRKLRKNIWIIAALAGKRQHAPSP